MIYWPFLVLNLLCTPPKLIKKDKFDSKYGTLTEDFKLKRTLYHRAYYALFVFHRIMVAFILVMLYETPFVQITLIFIIQVLVVYYVMQRRMFRSELQQVIGTSDEFVIIFGMVLLFLLYRNQKDPQASSRLGMAIVGII